MEYGERLIKGCMRGRTVRCDDISEERTSITCHACGRVHERVHEVSPVKGSNGRVARPAVVPYRLGWHGVAEPKHEGKTLCAFA